MARPYSLRKKLVLRLPWNLTKNQLYKIYRAKVRERANKKYRKYYRKYRIKKIEQVKARYRQKALLNE
jgi:hypothetical protein